MNIRHQRLAKATTHAGAVMLVIIRAVPSGSRLSTTAGRDKRRTINAARRILSEHPALRPEVQAELEAPASSEPNA